jgi:hypothetical protein
MLSAELGSHRRGNLCRRAGVNRTDGVMMATRKRIALLTTCVAVTIVTAGLYLRRIYPLQAFPPVASGPVEPTSAELAYKFHTTLSASEKQHVLDGDFALITSSEELPQSIKNAFATITGNKPFALADPGRKYQMTDIGDEPELLHRRLIFAGSYKNRWFLHYEHGGIGVSYTVMVLNIEPNNSVHFVWAGPTFRPAASLNDLRGAIASGNVADDWVFYW